MDRPSLSQTNMCQVDHSCNQREPKTLISLQKLVQLRNTEPNFHEIWNQDSL